MSRFDAGRVILGEVRELSTIEDAVALIDEWIAEARRLEGECVRLSMDVLMLECQLLLTKYEEYPPEMPQGECAPPEEYNPFP